MATANQSQPPAAWLVIKPFVNGGISGMLAITIIQPVDMVKVRLQLGATGGPVHVASNIIRKEGIGALYRGLSAGLLRQATYTTARMGLFNTFSDSLRTANGGKNLPLWQKAAAGLGAGALGALVGNPADLCLVRMQADSTLPSQQRRNYKGVGDALLRIIREEGVHGLFRGAGPTVVRAMSLNMGMLASYDQSKELLVDIGFEKGGSAAVLGSAIMAGVIAAACSLPFDFIKTRLQKMTPNPDGIMPYKGPVHCVLSTLKNEGPLVFYTGFPTYCIRIAPPAAFILIFVDVIPRFQKQFNL